MGESQLDHEISLRLNKEYGLVGEVLIVTIKTSYEGFNLKVYDPYNQLVYDKNHQGNKTLEFPISEPYGTYAFIASIPSANAKTWFTCLDVTSWKLASLPYQVTHKGVTYEFRNDWTIKANDLLLDFAFLRDLKNRYELEVTTLYNDMNFLVRFKKQPYFSLDLTFSFIWKGAKIIINGTQDQERTLSFSVPYAKRYLSSFRRGNTVFDFSDIPKNSYHVAGRIISLHVPESFWIDPTIFESGYETGDFSEWTGSGGSPTVETDANYTGLYGMEKIDGVGYSYQVLSPTLDRINVRFYVRSSSDCLDLADGNQIELIHIRNDTNGKLCGFGRARNSGVRKWWMYVRRVGGDNFYNATPAFQVDTWYCVEIEYYSNANGYARLYLDGILILDSGVADTTERGRVSTVRLGFTSFTGGTVATGHWDAVVFDDERIYCIPSDSEAPQWSNPTLSSTLAGNTTILGMNWTDNIELDSYVFSWNNTGVWVNDSASSFPGSPISYRVSVTKTVNNTIGLVIGWRYYANDTSNNWNVSAIQSFITTVDPGEADILSLNDMIFIFCLFQLIMAIIGLAGYPWVGLIAMFIGFFLLIPLPLSTPGSFLFDVQLITVIMVSIMSLISVALHMDKLS